MSVHKYRGMCMCVQLSPMSVSKYRGMCMCVVVVALGAATLDDTLTVAGNTVLGDAIADTTTIKGPATLESTLGVTGR